jgi:hypothetical protein
LKRDGGGTYCFHDRQTWPILSLREWFVCGWVGVQGIILPFLNRYGRLILSLPFFFSAVGTAGRGGLEYIPIALWIGRPAGGQAFATIVA